MPSTFVSDDRSYRPDIVRCQAGVGEKVLAAKALHGTHRAVELDARVEWVAVDIALVFPVREDAEARDRPIRIQVAQFGGLRQRCMAAFEGGAHRQLIRASAVRGAQDRLAVGARAVLVRGAAIDEPVALLALCCSSTLPMQRHDGNGVLSAVAPRREAV